MLKLVSWYSQYLGACIAHELWPVVDCHRLMLPTIALGYYFGCVILESQQSLLFRMYEIINLRIVTAVIAGMYDFSDSI